MAEFPVTKPEFIVPSCVNLSTYIQGMSDYEVRCYYSQLVQQWATEWAQMQTEWSSQQEAFESFKQYVNNKLQTFQDWFDNLDVQQEINNKIDEMVSDGTFLTIIQSTVNSQTQAATDAWLQQNMTPGAGAPALDSSLTLANAAAQSKVVGDYILPRDILLSDAPSSIRMLDISDVTTWAAGKVPYAYGLLGYVGVKVPVEPSTQLKYLRNSLVSISFYTDNGEYISTITGADGQTVPANAAYLVFPLPVQSFGGVALGSDNVLYNVNNYAIAGNSMRITDSSQTILPASVSTLNRWDKSGAQWGFSGRYVSVFVKGQTNSISGILFLNCRSISIVSGSVCAAYNPTTKECFFISQRGTTFIRGCDASTTQNINSEPVFDALTPVTVTLNNSNSVTITDGSTEKTINIPYGMVTYLCPSFTYDADTYSGADYGNIFKINALNYVDSPWQNKSWFAYGTSLTSIQQGRYADDVATATGMVLSNKGIPGGALVANRDLYNALMNDEDGKVDADIITIECGANDANTTLGNVLSFDTETFLGALNTCLKHIQQICPRARIILISSPRARYRLNEPDNLYEISTEMGGGYTLMERDECMRQCAVAQGIEFVCASQVGVGFYQQQYQNLYMVDNIHQTSVGGNNLANALVNKINSVSPIISGGT